MHEHVLVRNALSKGDILLVCTSADALPNNKTGAWLSEIAVPYCIFKRAGYDVLIASPKGGEVPIDEKSLKALEQEPSKVQELVSMFQADENARQMLSSAVPLDKVQHIKDYRAIFMAGGHGASCDFPNSDKLQQLVTEALDSPDVVVAALCHGVSVFGSEGLGKKLSGRRVTGFSDAEERTTGLEGEVPFLLESRLREMGVQVETGDNWSEKVVEDGNLITGQNPQSAAMLADKVVQYLNTHRPPGTPSHPGTMTAAEVPHALHVDPILPTAGGAVKQPPSADDMETDENGLSEPSMVDNLGPNAEPNPGTFSGNDTPASA